MARASAESVRVPYVTYELAEVTVSGRVFRQILTGIADAGLSYAAIAERKATGKVCLDDGKTWIARHETTAASDPGGRTSALPQFVSFEIAVQGQNRYADARNRRSSRECRLIPRFSPLRDRGEEYG